jgi:hypothetical protein
LRALRPDGSLFWRRSLAPPADQAIFASPVVDTDGSIHVVGVRSYTDHRITPAVQRSESRLSLFICPGPNNSRPLTSSIAGGRTQPPITTH